MLKLGKNELKYILMAGLFLAAVSFFLIVVTQKNFRAKTDILVVQNKEGYSDFYAMSKSSEYLTGILTESVYSEKFLDEMMASKIISSSFLPTDKVERLKEWQKIVKVSKDSSVGILSIEVYANSQKQATEISGAILDVITNKNNLFLGNNQGVEMRVLSGPIVEKNPTPTQIILVIAGGFVIGMFLMVMRIYYRNEAMKNNSESDFTLHN